MLKRMLIMALSVILITASVQSASAYDCDKWDVTNTFDSGDDGCWLRCSFDGEHIDMWCEDASWTSVTVEYECVDDLSGGCLVPCSLSTRVNYTLTYCDCVMECPNGWDPDYYTYTWGDVVYCYICQ